MANDASTVSSLFDHLRLFFVRFQSFETCYFTRGQLITLEMTKNFNLLGRTSSFFKVQSNRSVHLVLTMHLIQTEENVIEKKNLNSILLFSSPSLTHSLTIFSWFNIFSVVFFFILTGLLIIAMDTRYRYYCEYLIIISFSSFSKRFIA